MTSKKYDPQTHQLTLNKPTQVGAPAPPPPRISAAIFAAPAGKLPQFRTTLETTIAAGMNPLDFSAKFNESLKLELKHIYERLEKGLEEAWRSEWGYDGDPEATDEEEWARLFSELVVYGAYSGVKYAYSTANMEAASWEMVFMARCCYPTDPVFPIALACQHLSTLAILTRGYPASAVSNVTNGGAPVSSDDLGSLALDNPKALSGSIKGVTAGSNAALPIFKTKGKWVYPSRSRKATDEELKKNPNIDSLNAEDGRGRVLSDLISKDKLSPGSIFGFNPHGPNATSQPQGSHVGTVLRIVQQPPDFGIQAIDTGPLGATGGADNMTADHGAHVGHLPTLPGTLMGVGILPQQAPSAASLAALRKTRPIGLARLILFDDGNRVRFIGPLLPLHDGDKGFPVSKLVWSLRDLPAGALRGLWLVSSPQNKVALALLDPAARGSKLAQTLQAAGVDYGKTPHRKFSMDQHAIVSASGGAVSLFRFKSFTSDTVTETVWVDQDGGKHGKNVPSLSNTLKVGGSGQAANAFISALGAGESKIWRSASAANSESAEALLQGIPYFGGASTAPASAPPRATPPPQPALGDLANRPNTSAGR